MAHQNPYNEAIETAHFARQVDVIGKVESEGNFC
jgi:hypothetical protein